MGDKEFRHYIAICPGCNKKIDAVNCVTHCELLCPCCGVIKIQKRRRTMTKHTPGKWKVGADGLGVWNDKLNLLIAKTSGSLGIDRNEGEANAERIVTCVNACAGLSNEEVEREIPEMKALKTFLADTINWLEKEARWDKCGQLYYEGKKLLNRIEGGK